MQKNFVHWMFAAILICGACVFTSCSSNEDNPVIVANGPTITTQPENVTYNVGDTTYPKMSVDQVPKIVNDYRAKEGVTA